MTDFIADENVSQLVIERLRSGGFDIIAVREIRPGASDGSVLEMARAQSRILITEDRDFGELIVRQRLEVSGVMLLELDRLSNRAEAERTLEAISTLSDKLVGNIVIVEPSRVRIRPLRA